VSSETLVVEPSPGSLAGILGGFSIAVALLQGTFPAFALLAPGVARQWPVEDELAGIVEQMMARATEGPAETLGTAAALVGSVVLLFAGIALVARKGWGWHLAAVYAGLLVVSQALLMRAFPPESLATALAYPVGLLAVIIWIAPHEEVSASAARAVGAHVS